MFAIYNFSLPEWADFIWNYGSKILEHFGVLLLTSFSSTTEMKKLSIGFLLREILDRFKTLQITSLAEPEQKLWLYSAHDYTIANLMNALHVFDDVVTDHFCTKCFKNQDKIIFFFLISEACSTIFIQPSFWIVSKCRQRILCTAVLSTWWFWIFTIDWNSELRHKMSAGQIQRVVRWYSATRTWNIRISMQNMKALKNLNDFIHTLLI